MSKGELVDELDKLETRINSLLREKYTLENMIADADADVIEQMVEDMVGSIFYIRDEMQPETYNVIMGINRTLRSVAIMEINLSMANYMEMNVRSVKYKNFRRLVRYDKVTPEHLLERMGRYKVPSFLDNFGLELVTK